MATEWVPFLNALIKLLESLREFDGSDREKRDEAFIAVLTASDQTNGYIKASQQKATRDIEREHALANLWHICSIKVERFDADFARKCDLKGNYWKDPDSWTVEEINQTRIGLDRVTKEAEYLLKLKIRPARK